MQFTGHSLPVHHWSGTFTLSHIISWAHLRTFFRLLAIGMCHIRCLRNCRCDHHRAEITIMQFIGQSLPAHHFFYGTVRIFTLSHIVSQAVFYTGTCIKEHASSRSVVVVVLRGLLFWLTDWQNERVDQRYTEEELLVACVVISSQLRLPNCLRTVLLLLLGLVLQQWAIVTKFVYLFIQMYHATNRII